MEMDHFQRGIIVQCCHFDDPTTVKLQHLLVVHFIQPKINFCEIFLDLYPNSIQMLQNLKFRWDKTKENVLPESIDLSLFKSQHKGSSIFIVVILPNRFDFLLKEVNIGSYLHVRWSFEVLVESPELFNRSNVSYRMETIFKTVALWKLLIPKLQRMKQRESLVGLLHNI